MHSPNKNIPTNDFTNELTKELAKNTIERTMPNIAIIIDTLIFNTFGHRIFLKKEMKEFDNTIALEQYKIEKLQKQNINSFVNDVYTQCKQIDLDNINQNPDAHNLAAVMETARVFINVEELRSCFAKLLSANFDKNLSKYVHPSFPEILKQLSSDDAKMLENIYTAYLKNEPFLLYENSFMTFTNKDNVMSLAKRITPFIIHFPKLTFDSFEIRNAPFPETPLNINSLIYGQSFDAYIILEKLGLVTLADTFPTSVINDKEFSIEKIAPTQIIIFDNYSVETRINITQNSTRCIVKTLLNFKENSYHISEHIDVLNSNIMVGLHTPKQIVLTPFGIRLCKVLFDIN